MSNALAIAAVTETLVQVLQGSLSGINLTEQAHVTNVNPDSTDGLPSVGVNVFLYQIAPNPYLRNADLPTRSAEGTLLRRPQAAIDLYYLLTFYGNDATLEQQRILGAVVRELHANPTLPRATIASVEGSTGFLLGADLDKQSELVRFTPVNFSLEELSKLWSFLLKTDYVLSAAYVASVVLIETDDPTPPAPLPVLAANIYALPFRQPVIIGIQSAQGPDALILPQTQIAISGVNFLASPQPGGGASTTQVIIGGTALTPAAVSDTRILLTLPAGLAAGVQEVQIVQSLLLGTPPTPHQGFQSEAATFLLHPLIQQSGSPPQYAITVLTGVGSPPGDELSVGVTPTVLAGQQALLELLQPGQPMTTRLVSTGPIAAATSTLVFPLSGVPSGDYLVRVRVDGAASPLQLDPSGVPIAPTVSL